MQPLAHKKKIRSSFFASPQCRVTINGTLYSVREVSNHALCYTMKFGLYASCVSVCVCVCVCEWSVQYARHYLLFDLAVLL